MLLKVYQTGVLFHAPLRSGNAMWEGDYPRDYMHSYDSPYAGVKTIYTTSDMSEDSYGKIYAILSAGADTNRNNNIHLACWERGTGRLLWIDRETWAPYGLDWAIWRWSMFQDDRNDVWSVYLASSINPSVIRHPRIKSPISNSPGGQPGEVSHMTYDREILTSHWKDESGGPASGFVRNGFVHNIPLTLMWGADKAIIHYLTRNPLGQQPLYPRYVGIHAISSGIRLGYAYLKEEPWRALAVDSNTAYVIGETGAIDVIDINRMLNLGTLYFGQSIGSSISASGSAGASLKRVEFGYDREYRRLLALPLTPDDQSQGGRATARIFGYAMRPVGERITPPLPLEKPVQGRQIKVMSRIYGQSGVGGGSGLAVTFEVDDWRSGSFRPASATTDGFGVAQTLWSPGYLYSGVNPQELRVRSDVQQSLDGLLEQDYVPITSQPPASVIQLGLEDQFFPGWWLSSRAFAKTRSETAEDVFEPYLSEFSTLSESGDEDDDRPNCPFAGALVEYSWFELQPSSGTYNLSKIFADLAYLKSKGLKMMISIRTSAPLGNDGSIWIPNFIAQDTSGTYPLSGNVVGGAGVFASVNNRTFRTEFNTVCPNLFDDLVRAQYVGLLLRIALDFSSDPDVVGLFPIDMPAVDSAGVSGAYQVGAVPVLPTLDDWWARRREILESVAASNAFHVFDWYCETLHEVSTQNSFYLSRAPASHRSWCVSNAIGLCAPMFITKLYGPVRSTYLKYDLMPIAGDVPTGVQVADWCWGFEDNAVCGGGEATPKETLFASPATQCSGYDALENAAKPWFAFLEVSPVHWDGQDDIKPTCLEQSLSRAKAYYG
jgi:hypothetical protein